MRGPFRANNQLQNIKNYCNEMMRSKLVELESMGYKIEPYQYNNNNN